MQKAAQEINPRDIIEIVLRRRWWIIVPFCLSMIVGICLAIMLPRIYSAKTIILIQPQKVPTNYVQSVVSMDIDSRLNILKQQILSRSNLEKIIQDFNLFSEPKYENMFVEDKINELRNKISIELIFPDEKRDSRRFQPRGQDAFSISFKGKDPEKVLRITNSLTSYVIDANLKARATEAIGTSNFLREEVDSIQIELAEKEKTLKEYREKYMGGLPQQLETNLRMLDRLQERLNARKIDLINVKNKLAILENQILEGDILLNRNSGEPLTVEEAKARLAYSETRYTDKHPDVIRYKKMITEMKKKNKNNDKDTSDGAPYIPINLRIQKQQYKAEIETYMADISNLTSQIRDYQKRVEDTPRKEQELLLVERDYNNIKKSHNELLSRKLEAEISFNMEKKQKGEQFQIIDSATLPEKPISPNMKILFLLTLVAGPNIGLGLIFLMEYFNTSFRNPEDLESYLDLSVLATLPIVYHEKDKRKQRLSLVFSILSVMLSCVLLIAFAVLSLKGVDQTMELLNNFIIT
jgi:polysaccharide chain length determinant protein (PEP-CTERM system associated)